MSEEKRFEVEVLDRKQWRRVLIRDGEQDISHLGYSAMPVCVGPAGEVRMAGIGGVGTEPAYRRAGLAQRVFARAMEEIRAEGYSCAGLYTGTHIVAHRMYRRYGFVDTQCILGAAKFLDPASYVLARFIDLFRGDEVPSEVRAWTGTLSLELTPHPPFYLRIHRGEVSLLKRKPKQIDLALVMSSGTFMQLARDLLPLEYAVTAHLLQWRGSETAWQRLAAAINARHRAVYEGG